MAKKAWTYRDGGSYGLNSYGKPALVLQTLEGLLGEETMVKVLRTYARRYRFAHPTTEDFLATVDEVTGGGWRWYFNETFFSGDLCDYAVEVKSEPVRQPAGFFPDEDGALAYREAPEKARAQGRARRRALRDARDDPAPRRGAAAGRAAGRVRGRPRRERALERPRPLVPLPLRGSEGGAGGGRPGPQDRDRRRTRPTTSGSPTSVPRAARPRSGPRATCSGSRTCWSCTRSWGSGMLASLRDGCRSLGLNWGLVVLVLLTNLGFALVAAVPLAFQLETELENRGASSAMMYGFDYDWWSHWSERQQGPGSALGPELLGTGFALKNLELLLKGWLPAGLFARGEGSPAGRPADPRARPRLPGAAGLPDGRHHLRLPPAARGLDACAAWCTAAASTSAACSGSACWRSPPPGSSSRSTRPSRASWTASRARRSRAARRSCSRWAGTRCCSSRCCSCTWSSPTPAC